MTSEPTNAPPGALGAFEYELSDELAHRATTAFYERSVARVTQVISEKGISHPALPLVMATAMLVVGQAAVLIWGRDFALTPYLLAASVLCQLLLLFKSALYFYPRFGQWYIGIAVRRSVRRLSSRTIRWTFFEDRLETWSAGIQKSIPWTDIKRVDCVGEFWFLDIKRTWLMVPAAVLSVELRRLIGMKVGVAEAALKG